MASIKSYKTANGRAWRVQYRSPDGRSRTKQGFKTKTEAQSWAAKNVLEIEDNQWVSVQDKRRTVGELGELWMRTRTHLKPSTLRVVEQHWRVHVQPRWGHLPLTAVRHSEIQAWVAELSERRSPTIVRGAHNCLSQILDMAVRDGVLKQNAANNITLPKKQPATKVYLTIEQLATLAGECTRNSELVWLLGTSGLRFGEAAALRPMDLDTERNRIHITRNAVTVGADSIIGTPKTNTQRTVAVAQHVMDMLTQKAAGLPADGLLWARADGTPMRVPGHGSWFDTAMHRVRAKDPDFPRITPHGLRHVAAGLLVQSGANVKVVQRQLGHASAAMTLDVYAELFDDGLDAIAAKLDELVGKSEMFDNGLGAITEK